jgi:NADPH2:quinone reductase
MDERMLAARYETAGPRLGVLELAQLDRPRPQAGEVLVRLRVSGVNPTDVRAREGTPFHVAAERVVPGHDGAGKIIAVGDGVPETRVGELVWCHLAQWRRALGTSAQYVALPSALAVRLPDGVSLDLGAGLGIPAMTAHRCLHLDGPIDGARILVHGGAGAVGHAAIELARVAGARVAATVSSPEKAELARAAGAELVVDYTREAVAETIREWAPSGVDRVVEVALGANIETDAAVLAPFAAIASYGAPDRPIAAPRPLMAANSSIHFVLVYTMPDAAKRHAVEDITRALDAGALTALPPVRFPLERIAEAHEAVRGHALGKVLLDIP